MRQVPKYAIIGAGRMARHFTYYLKLLEIPYIQWSRSHDTHHSSLEHAIQYGDIILLLIKDAAIEDFIHHHLANLNKTLVHFSGQLVTELAHGAHPLMSFGQNLYSLEVYQKIPFILDDDDISFHQLFPNLSNPHFKISRKDKPLYHSLCVLSGNFTVLLWQKLFDELENKFNIPKEYAHLYLQQICQNLQQDPKTALSGPLIRNDKMTISANLTALNNDPYQKVYQSFLEAYYEYH